MATEGAPDGELALRGPAGDRLGVDVEQDRHRPLPTATSAGVSRSLFTFTFASCTKPAPPNPLGGVRRFPIACVYLRLPASTWKTLTHNLLPVYESFTFSWLNLCG